MNHLKLDQLEPDLKQGRLSRRDFIKASALLGLSTAIPGLLFSQNTQAATPESGGNFRIAVGDGSTTDSLDPAASTTGQFVIMLNKSIHNYLTEIRADDSLGPELATNWEASADAKTWTFKLRKGVEFHNGKTLTPQDVIASLNYHGGEESKSAAKFIVDAFQSIEAQGDDVLVITLKEGNADLAYQLSHFQLIIIPADQSGNLDITSGIGCGSYVLKNFEPGVRAELNKFDNHWNDKEGHLASAEMLLIKDAVARMTALRTGEVDAIDRLDIKTLHLLERDKNVHIMETSGNSHYSMPMRCDTEPFKDNNIRLALKHCIDRETMLETLLRGHGYVGNDHPIGRANRYFSADIEQRSYDPDRAKYYLKQAGLDKLKVQLSAADAAFTGAVDAAVLYREDAAKAGIDVEVIREADDGYWSDVWKKKPWCMCYWNGRPTEDLMLSSAYTSDAAWNDTFWQNEKFDALVKEARSELDEGKRAEMYAEAQRIINNEGGVGIPLFNNYLFASRKNIGQPEQLGNDLDIDGLRAIVRWWHVG